MELKNIEDFYPLSALQHGMLFDTLYAPRSGVYCYQIGYSLEGDVDVSAFKRAKWNGEPSPVRQTLIAVPSLPESLVPESLRPWLIDIAERISCPLDFAVVPALLALGTVLGRKIGDEAQSS